MINWELFSPRNFLLIGAVSILAYFIYAHFNKVTTVSEV